MERATSFTSNKENPAMKTRLRAKEDQFNFHDDDMSVYTSSLEELERRLFGIVS